jgi:hypothetical protein
VFYERNNRFHHLHRRASTAHDSLVEHPHCEANATWADRSSHWRCGLKKTKKEKMELIFCIQSPIPYHTGEIQKVTRSNHDSATQVREAPQPIQWRIFMKKTWKSSVLLLGTAMLGAVALSGTNAMAAGEITEIPVTVTLTQSVVESLAKDMDFGSIDINPAGDVITMDCKATAVSPGGTILGTAGVTKGSTVTGAGCAELVITADNNLTVQVDYAPVSNTLNLRDTLVPGNPVVLVLSEVNAHSGANSLIPFPVTGGSPGTIFVGGKLTVPAGAPTSTYGANLPITVNYL